MAARFTLTAGAYTYDAVEDRILSFTALATGVVTDEVTGRPPRTAVTVATTREGGVPKYFDHGVWCIAGDVELVLPQYPTAVETIDYDVSADDYRPASPPPVTIPVGAALPVTAPDVALRPLPVRLEGRVTRHFLDPTSVGDAIVRVANRAGQSVVSLRTPLHASHPAGTAVRAVSLTAAGTPRTLTESAESGVQTIALDDVTGLAGELVGLDWKHALEFAKVSSIDTAAGTATLTGRLTRTYPRDVALDVFTVTVTPGLPVFALDRDADPGDGLLLLTLLTTPPTTLPDDAAAVQIANATAPDVEYASVGALTDANGFYALEGIGGVETIDLRVRETPTSTDGPRVPQTLEYGQRTNVVNLKLAP